jgi:hypothetical protein
MAFRVGKHFIGRAGVIPAEISARLAASLCTGSALIYAYRTGIQHPAFAWEIPTIERGCLRMVRFVIHKTGKP